MYIYFTGLVKKFNTVLPVDSNRILKNWVSSIPILMRMKPKIASPPCHIWNKSERSIILIYKGCRSWSWSWSCSWSWRLLPLLRPRFWNSSHFTYLFSTRADQGKSMEVIYALHTTLIPTLTRIGGDIVTLYNRQSEAFLVSGKVGDPFFLKA